MFIDENGGAGPGVRLSKPTLSHQPGVVRQRPAFDHRLARIEPQGLKKFPAKVLI
jgi:hypothetical protein